MIYRLLEDGGGEIEARAAYASGEAAGIPERTMRRTRGTLPVDEEGRMWRRRGYRAAYRRHPIGRVRLLQGADHARRRHRRLAPGSWDRQHVECPSATAPKPSLRPWIAQRDGRPDQVGNRDRALTRFGIPGEAFGVLLAGLAAEVVRGRATVARTLNPFLRRRLEQELRELLAAQYALVVARDDWRRL